MTIKTSISTKSSRHSSEASMLKKEISDVFKQTIIFTVFSLTLPALLIITTTSFKVSYFSVFLPMFQFGLLFGAFFMGASLFSIERGQRGMEYLLSLPYSRYQVVGIKILPRLASVLLFYVVFTILYTSGGEDLVALSFFSFTFIYFSLYLISLALSASSENFLVLFVISRIYLLRCQNHSIHHWRAGIFRRKIYSICWFLPTDPSHGSL
jgi:hypothetical protein